MLARLRHAHGSVYLGMIQWQGGCTLSEVRSGSADVQPCLGCWGGWYRGGAPSPSTCQPMWRANWKGAVREQTDACPAFRLAPFACGPFEARSRHLAHTVARCEYADRYFAAMSRRGDAKSDWCVSTDGGQGNVLGECVRSMHIADLGPRRQKYATRLQLNESHSVFIVHPIKSRGAEHSPARVPRLVEQWREMWEYLRRAPHVHATVAESRITFRRNESRPLTERLPAHGGYPGVHEAAGARGRGTTRASTRLTRA